MILDDYNALNEMLGTFRQEADEMDIQIQNNLRRMKELEIYLQSLVGVESEDFKVFSPRKAEVIYKEEIGKTQKQIKEFEEQNKELCSKRDILYGRIHTIEEILGHYNTDFVAQTESMKNLLIYSMEDLNQLIQKLEMSSAYIDKNPIQVKQDFVIIGKRLKEMLMNIDFCLNKNSLFTINHEAFGVGKEASRYKKQESIDSREQ